MADDSRSMTDNEAGRALALELLFFLEDLDSDLEGSPTSVTKMRHCDKLKSVRNEVPAAAECARSPEAVDMACFDPRLETDPLGSMSDLLPEGRTFDSTEVRREEGPALPPFPACKRRVVRQEQ
jgi:hypothetical protein